MCFGSTEESIHPFFAAYLGLDHGGSRPSREDQTSLSQTTSSTSSSDTEAFPRQLKDVTSAANPVNLFFHSLGCTVQLVQQCICVGFSFSQIWGPYYVELHTSIGLAWCIMPSRCTFFSLVSFHCSPFFCSWHLHLITSFCGLCVVGQVMRGKMLLVEKYHKLCDPKSPQNA